MKKTTLVAALGGFALTAAFAEKSTVKLDTDDAKFGYALGGNIANQIKRDQLTIDADAVAAAIKDVFAGKESALTPEEVQKIMSSVQEKAMANQQKVASEQGDKNGKEETEYLEKNGKKAGVKTTASGLQYEVVSEGKGDKPTANDTVKVHYHGTLLSGKVFDSSVDRKEPAEFPVSGVIPGWVEGLQLMTVGSKYKFTIPSKLAYGANGAGADIGPNSCLQFDVELLEIKKAAPAPAAPATAAPEKK
jgi:FKBP-type peptidyl-prolyl cis-trans isomerase FklB